MDQHPALIPHLLALLYARLEGLHVLEIDERAVDRDTSCGAGGHGGVKTTVGLLHGFGGQLYPHVLAVIDRAEDQRIDALARGRGGVGIDHPLGRFDQKLNGDAAHLKTPSALQFFKLPVEPLHVVRLAGLGQTDAGEAFVDNRLEVVVRHQGFPIVDPGIDL